MKRRGFLQLMSGAVVSVPLAKNLTFEIPEEDWEEDWELPEDDTPTNYIPRGSGPHVGDVIIIDDCKVDLLSNTYSPNDIFECAPAVNDGYLPLREFAQEVGMWGDMKKPHSVDAPKIHPTWIENKGGFDVDWFLLRNKTRDINFARVYVGDYGSNKESDLTITWSHSLMSIVI
jgi:hypothetical protein